VEKPLEFGLFFIRFAAIPVGVQNKGVGLEGLGVSID
jgi:hypothetical protein